MKEGEEEGHNLREEAHGLGEFERKECLREFRGMD